MLTQNKYALYEVHVNGEERRLSDGEKPLWVQLNWGKDVREGRFLLKNEDEKTVRDPALGFTEKEEPANFKRKLSKREKKEKKKREAEQAKKGDSMAGKLYSEAPETSFTRSISNPEAVMRRRRQQKLEKKLAQMQSREGGPDSGGTLKIYGESLQPDVPYKTLLLSTADTTTSVIREAMEKYGLEKEDPEQFCLVEVLLPPGSLEYHGGSVGEERVLDEGECPLAIVMQHPKHRGHIIFQLRRRSADNKKRPKRVRAVSHDDLRKAHDHPATQADKLPYLIELNPRAHTEGIVTVTPTTRDAEVYVEQQRVFETTMLRHGMTIQFGRSHVYRFVDPRNTTTTPTALAFWMANASEVLHFFKQDLDVQPYGADSQELLAEAVQMAFHHLLFSQLFHFINMWLFNILVMEPQLQLCTRVWGFVSSVGWGELKPGLRNKAWSWLLTAICVESYRCDLRRILTFHLPFLLPEDGYSCDTIRGIPNGLPEFVTQLTNAGICHMVANNKASGSWTVYMGSQPPQEAPRSPQATSQKSSQCPSRKSRAAWDSALWLPLERVCRKEGSTSSLWYQAGAAALDGRLKAGDQLLEVDGKSLVGLSQDKPDIRPNDYENQPQVSPGSGHGGFQDINQNVKPGVGPNQQQLHPASHRPSDRSSVSSRASSNSARDTRPQSAYYDAQPPRDDYNFASRPKSEEVTANKLRDWQEKYDPQGQGYRW
nr:hypothetical protein BaRGS_018777 [Batillaria attramentaria]